MDLGPYLAFTCAMCMCAFAATPESCLLTEARVLSIATVFGLTIGILVYASASFSGAASAACHRMMCALREPPARCLLPPSVVQLVVEQRHLG